MPLSEEELRLLEQMERALVAEDPKLASTLRGAGLLRRARRQLILSGVAFVLGVALLMAGAVLRITAVGIAGFVVMLGSAYLGLEGWRGRTQAAAEPGSFRAPQKSTVKSRASFMERLEERWRRRRDGDGS